MPLSHAIRVELIVAPTRQTLRFATNSARLTATQRARISGALPRVRSSNPIVISGRTDDQGTDAVKEALALARGLAFRDHMLDRHPVLSARIIIYARGRCRAGR